MILRHALLLSLVSWTGTATHADGALDPTYGLGGSAIIYAPTSLNNTGATHVSCLADGSMIAAVNSPGVASGAYFAKFTAGGLHDTSFRANYVLQQINACVAISSMVTDRQGRTVLGGAAYGLGDDLQQCNYVAAPQPYISRLLADGTYDPSFNGGGYQIQSATIPTPANTYIEGGQVDALVADDADGYVLAMSSTYCIFGPGCSQLPVMIRLSENGSIDSNFGDGGSTIWSGVQPPAIAQVLKQYDGAYFLAGAMNNTASNSTVYIGKTSLNGVIDPDFGLKQVDYISGNGYTSIVGLQEVSDEDGFFILTADAPLAIGIRLATTRVGSDGTIGDPLFTNLNPFSFSAIAAHLYPSGQRMVVAGSVPSTGVGSTQYGVIAVQANGQIDSTFGTNGLAVIPSLGTSNDIASSICMQAGGMVISGAASIDASEGFRAVRLTGDFIFADSFGFHER